MTQSNDMPEPAKEDEQDVKPPQSPPKHADSATKKAGLRTEVKEEAKKSAVTDERVESE